ncbi:MAG: NAD(P)/FAD-dependent oxidoreductase [Bacilli bacterium]
MFDIIIIGGGIAGITAGIYASRAGKEVLILEQGMYGGQIASSSKVENFPTITSITGADFSMKLYEQVKYLNINLKNIKVYDILIEENKKTVLTENGTFEAKSIIVATGSSNRKLNLENEQRLLGKGVSYCATCDGAFFKGKDVAILGGGNTALEDAVFLSNYCNKVYIIHRNDKFTGENSFIETLKTKENVEFIFNFEIKKINGNEILESLQIINNQTKEIKELNVEGLFIAIGQVPNSSSFKSLIDINPNGYFIANEDCKTKIPGVFVSGDCRTKEIRQLVTAASDGAVAGLEAVKYIGSLK